MTIAEVEARIARIRGYDSQTAFEWSSEAVDHILAHECGHAVVAYATGAQVSEICCWPALPAELKNGKCVGIVNYKSTLPDPLAVLVAGELAQSQRQHRPFDFKHSTSRNDRQHAQQAIDEWYEKPTEIESTNIFKMAVETARRILETNSLAVACLAFKLKKPPFRLDGDQFESFMRRMNVNKI